MHHYTHITASPLYTSTHHTIERLSRSSWQITSPLLAHPITAKTYAEAKQLASEIDFNALSVKAADPEPVATAAVVEVEAMVQTEAEVEANPFEAILTEAATIRDLGTMQGAYDQAVRECDLCAVFGHLGFRAPTNAARDAVEAARAQTSDSARVVELAGLLTGDDSGLWARVSSLTDRLTKGRDMPLRLVECLCDLPDTAGYIKRALILWACAVGDGEASWVARLRLEGAALRYARERAHVEVAQGVRKVEDGGLADMGGDRAREWGDVWDVADDLASACFHHDGASLDDATWEIDSTEDWDAYKRARKEVKARLRGELVEILPNLLSPEPEHWIPLQDGRVLIVNWRAGEVTGEVVSAAVWMDDGGLSLMGSYVLGSGWVSDDRLGEEDVDTEALGVILEAIARAGLAAIA